MIAPCFSRGQLEQLARLLGEEVTGTQLYLDIETSFSDRPNRAFNEMAAHI